MRDPGNVDGPPAIVNLVNNPIIPDSDSPMAVSAYQFLAAAWARV